MRLYEEGYKLKDNEYLLKVRPNGNQAMWPGTGFLTKFNKDGSMPVAFKEFGRNIYLVHNPTNSIVDTSALPIQIVEEVPRRGWKLFAWRIGQSQEWATLIHPDGYTVEVYLKNFLEIIKDNVVNHGEIMAEFRWQDRKLVK